MKPKKTEEFSPKREEPLIAEFYLRLEDGRVSRGRIRMTYTWSFDDWRLLQECSALDVEEFCGSMLFEIFIQRYGTAEQKRRIRMIRGEIKLEL
jgi:hypothetical protein